MSYIDATAAWIDLFRNAYETLRPEQFRTWLIGVGLEGSDSERLRKGLEIYEILNGAANQSAVRVTYPRKNDG